MRSPDKTRRGALRRRSGAQFHHIQMGPGSAAHHFVLRCARDTSSVFHLCSSDPAVPVTAPTAPPPADTPPAPDDSTDGAPDAVDEAAETRSAGPIRRERSGGGAAARPPRRGRSARAGPRPRGRTPAGGAPGDPNPRRGRRGARRRPRPPPTDAGFETLPSLSAWPPAGCLPPPV